MNTNRSFRFACLAALLLTIPARAQVDFDLSFVEGSPPEFGAFFGTSLLAVDVDGDGFCDLIAGEPNADQQGVLDSGRAWILYGPDFQRRKLLAPRVPMQQEFLGTSRSAFGDFDGDGHSDIVLMAPTAMDSPYLPSLMGRARIFFGPDFEEQMLLRDPTPQDVNAFFGWYSVVVHHPATGQQELLIAAHRAWVLAPDNTFDFIGEIISWPDGPGVIGVPIENPDPVTSSTFGSTLLVADLDGDGHPELLAGRTGGGFGVPQGDIAVLDAVTKQPLWNIQAPPGTPEYGPILSFGFSHFAGDLLGDGSVSLVAGAPSTRVGPIKPGVLFVLGGTDFSAVQHALFPSHPANDGRYGEKAFVADVDVDGHLDIVVPTLGSPFVATADNVVDIHFGPDFTRVQFLNVAASSFASEGAVGDFDGDGCLEVAVTASLGVGQGRVYIHDRRSLHADVAEVSVSAGTSVALSLDFGIPGAHRDYLVALSLSGTSPGLVAAPGSFLPLNPDAATLAGFALSHTTILVDFSGILDSQGRASAVLNWPAGAGSALIGQQLTLAAMALAPGNRPGFGSSALTLPIGP